MTTFVGLAIPAIGLFVTKLAMIAAPFIAAVAAASPFIAAALAAVTAFYALWKSGITVQDTLGAMGIKMESITKTIDSLREWWVRRLNILVQAQGFVSSFYPRWGCDGGCFLCVASDYRGCCKWHP